MLLKEVFAKVYDDPGKGAPLMSNRVTVIGGIGVVELVGWQL